ARCLAELETRHRLLILYERAHYYIDRCLEMACDSSRSGCNTEESSKGSTNETCLRRDSSRQRGQMHVLCEVETIHRGPAHRRRSARWRIVVRNRRQLEISS